MDPACRAQRSERREANVCRLYGSGEGAYVRHCYRTHRPGGRTLLEHAKRYGWKPGGHINAFGLRPAKRGDTTAKGSDRWPRWRGGKAHIIHCSYGRHSFERCILPGTPRGDQANRSDTYFEGPHEINVFQQSCRWCQVNKARAKREWERPTISEQLVLEGFPRVPA